MPRFEQFHLSPDHNYFGHHGRAPSQHPTLAVSELHCVAGRGIVGDRFFNYQPDYAGQITFFSAEIFEELQRTFSIPQATPASTRRNVVMRSLDLTSLVDRDFCLQGVWFRGAGECKPCYWMNTALAPDSEVWLRGRGGLRAAFSQTEHCGWEPRNLCAAPGCWLLPAQPFSRRLSFPPASPVAVRQAASISR